MKVEKTPVAIIVLDGIDALVSLDGAGRLEIRRAVEDRPILAALLEDADGGGDGPPFVDMLAAGRAWLRPVLRSDAGSPPRSPAEVLRDGRERRRAVARLMCDAARVPAGDKAIDRFLVRAWDAGLVAEFGPAPRPRTVRYWRRMAEMRDRRASDESAGEPIPEADHGTGADVDRTA